MADQIKVTLTADDQATEIVRRLAAAVKQLDAQQRAAAGSTAASGAAAKGAESAFSAFGDAILRVAEVLGLIRVVEFVKNTIEATDQIGKLAEKTGATVEALSILAFAANKAEISQEDLGNGLKFLSKAVSQLQENLPATVEAFAALGLSAKDLKGLSLDQVLIKVADAQSRFSDGAGKAADVMKLFGRNGVLLIPLLNDLAHGGFDEVAKKAQDLGIVLSTGAVESARQFDEALTTLKASFKGLVIALSPAIKGVADLVAGIAELVAHNGELLAFTATMLGVAFAINKIFDAWVALKALSAGAGLLSLFTPAGVTIAALAALATAVAFVVVQFNAYKNAKKALEEPLATDPALNKALGLDKPKPDVALVDPAQRKALIEAEIAATKAGLKQELEATQTGLQLVTQLDDAAFAQGLLSLTQFYDERVAITKQGVRAQVDELEAQKQALSASPLPQNTPAEEVKRATELKTIQAEIDKAKAAGQTQVLVLLEAERQKRLQIATEVRGFEEQILTAQGNAAAAAQLHITDTVNKFVLALDAQGGHTLDEINAQAAQFRSLLTLQAQFAQAQTRASEEQTSLDEARAAVQLRVTQGLESQRQGQLDIAAIERARLPTLENLASQMDKFAAATGDPKLVQAAEQFRASFAGIGKVIDESTLKLANLGGTLLTGVQSDLSQFLGTTISQVNSLSEAFNALVGSLASTVQRTLGDLFASQITEKIRSLFEGTATVAPQVAAATETATAATELGTAGLTVLSGATELAGSAFDLGTAGFTLIDAAGALSAAAAEMAAANAASGASLLGFASGGAVSGRGTGTSDSILARLSHGEYVIRAAAVKKLGVPFLDLLNGLRMPSLIRPGVSGIPAFAAGGFVSGGSSSATISGGVDVTVSAGPGTVIDTIRTRGGLKALRDVVSQNPQLFKAALGLG